MNSCPFPTSTGGAFPPKDGYFIKCPSHFQKGSRRYYELFLQSLPQQEKFVVDPVGFSAIPFKLKGQWSVICGIRVEGFFDRKTTKKIIGTDFNPIMPLASFAEMMKRFRTLAEAATVSLPSGPEREAQEFVAFTMHEIRKLNVQVKSQAEEVIQNLTQQADRGFLDYRAQNIFATSSLVSIRLDCYDFHVNPKAFSSEPPKPVPVYKKFEKVSHCLQILSKQERVRFKFEGQSFVNINGYPIFEILPFVVLENAVKYSPQNQEITIKFSSEYNRIIVRVESLGPMLTPDERERLTQNGFRGAWAQQVRPGSGLGLHFASLVCKLHGIDLHIDSSPSERLRLNGIPYSVFSVQFSMPTLQQSW